jgi:type I restriction enzyme M protein
VTFADIKASDYNLDFANPNPDDDLAHRPPQELIKELIAAEHQILDVLSGLEQGLDSSL